MSKSHTDFPLSGVFHVLDDTDPNSSLGTSENDSVSTNGSCAGETAEDPAPCKVTRYIPGLEAAPSKQEKNRLKNERKHQRQKERKTKELKERCHGLLMSRKLDKLALKLISMGFSSDKATIALKMNEGDLERSINFLVENEKVSQEEVRAKPLKVDISVEVSSMANLEQKLGYPAIEIQRAVVACEGDIDHAIKWLREHSSSTTLPPQEQQRRASPTPPLSQHQVRGSSRSYREPGTTAFPAPNYPVEHLAVHHREPGTIPSAMNYRREPSRPVVNYREPPGLVSSTSPRGPARSFPPVSNGEYIPGGGGRLPSPHVTTFQDPPRTQPVPRTQLPANVPFELPAWTMREMPKRNVYADWRNSHPATHPSMNRLEETGPPLMHELYASPQKPRTPSFDHPQNLQWPELHDRARMHPFQELHDRILPSQPPMFYNRGPTSYERIPSAVSRGAVGPGGLRNMGRIDGGAADGWNVERAQSVDYKSIDWSLNPVASMGWSGSPRETRPFTKDILPAVL